MRAYINDLSAVPCEFSVCNCDFKNPIISFHRRSNPLCSYPNVRVVESNRSIKDKIIFDAFSPNTAVPIFLLLKLINIINNRSHTSVPIKTFCSLPYPRCYFLTPTRIFVRMSLIHGSNYRIRIEGRTETLVFLSYYMQKTRR